MSKKSTELTWEDIKTISTIISQVEYELRTLPYNEIEGWALEDNAAYKEALRRFNEEKKK